MSDDGSDESPAPAALPAPATGTGGHQTSPSEIIRTTKEWSNVAKSFMYVEVASLVLMFSCIGVWVSGVSLLSYALSVSVISLMMCLIIQTGEFVKPGLLDKVEKPVSLFLLLWWILGTGIITFKGPFTRVENGYFSAWAGLIFTAHWALNIDASKFTELEKGQKILFGICVAAGVELFATIPFISAGFYVGQSAWGLTAGLLTLIICGVLFKTYDELNAQVGKICAVLMFVIWATVAGVLTFDGPFVNGNGANGYFASWAGFLLSIFFLQHVMAMEDEIV